MSERAVYKNEFKFHCQGGMHGKPIPRFGRGASISTVVMAEAFATEPPANCRADQGSDQATSETLTEQLDRCNGVLAPPTVGDQEMVEPAPRVGSMPVIRPEQVPDQNAEPENRNDIPRADKAIEAGSGIDQIVSWIAGSSDAAKRIESMAVVPRLNVVNVSVVFAGDKTEILKTALLQHEKGIDQLREALTGNPALSKELEEQGVSTEFVVAARIENDEAVTVFVR